MARRSTAKLTLLLVALGAGLVAGCVSRPVREDVFRFETTEVFLRKEKRITSTVEKDHDHPAVISPSRMAHILSRIDVRASASQGGKRQPAIATETLYPIAEGVVKALNRADPDQEVVVMSVQKTRNFGVFDHDFLTSFLAYVRGDQLYVHLSRVNWKIPKRREDRLPEPKIGDQQMGFRVFEGQAMRMVDSQSVAIEYADPIFKRATRTRITATGQVVRKNILMESPPEEDLADAPERDPNYFPEGLSASQLRDLADLEDARRSGKISEGQYRTRRRKILSR